MPPAIQKHYAHQVGHTKMTKVCLFLCSSMSNFSSHFIFPKQLLTALNVRLLSLIFLLAAATAQIQPRPIQSIKRNDVVPNSYIVKLKEDAALSINRRDANHHASFHVSISLFLSV